VSHLMVIWRTVDEAGVLLRVGRSAAGLGFGPLFTAAPTAHSKRSQLSGLSSISGWASVLRAG
jgi:hypothetical protein